MSPKPSWKRMLGVTKAKRSVARMTGIPTTRAGRRRKVERTVFKAAGCSIAIASLIAVASALLIGIALWPW